MASKAPAYFGVTSESDPEEVENYSRVFAQRDHMYEIRNICLVEVTNLLKIKYALAYCPKKVK